MATTKTKSTKATLAATIAEMSAEDMERKEAEEKARAEARAFLGEHLPAIAAGEAVPKEEVRAALEMLEMAPSTLEDCATQYRFMQQCDAFLASNDWEATGTRLNELRATAEQLRADINEADKLRRKIEVMRHSRVAAINAIKDQGLSV